MELLLSRSTPSAVAADALVLLQEEALEGKCVPRPDLSAAISGLCESGEITGKSLELTLLHNVHGFAAKRILVAGVGKPGKLTPTVLRRIAGAAVRHLKTRGVRTIAFACDSKPDDVALVAEGALLGLWEPDYLKSEREKQTLETLTIVVSDKKAALDAALQKGKVLGEAANLSRDIAVQPPNLLTPLELAARARQMAETNGLSIDILDRDRMKQLGMGSLLGVAQGSAEPPALIVIDYKPASASNSARLGIVGKGVTFDTGGISIKPSDGMDKMKYDMAGAAAVVGAMQAIAQLKPAVRVTALIPTVENMPGDKAQRPGDIVKSMSGKTIEVLNTDAEGRLILADAITYAKQLGCTHLVDAATLTGAIVVAIGSHASGAFSNDEALASAWMAASEAGCERMWRMPLFDEYRDQMKSVYADIANIGGREGGASTAAIFIKEFVGDTPWVHVDIAATAWLDEAKPWMAKGPTAVPINSFVNLALNWK